MKRKSIVLLLMAFCILLCGCTAGKDHRPTAAEPAARAQLSQAWESIFEPFQCSDASRQTKDGSGLGLAIARRIMQLHGGGLRVVDGFEGYTKAFVAEL